VENTRVGKMTNWDKLLITLKTDGTISPREAFNKAAQILVDQFSALLPSAQKPAPEIESKEESVDLETKEVAEVDADEADKPAKKKSKK